MQRLLPIILFITALAASACAHTGTPPATDVAQGLYYGVGEARGLTQPIAVAQNRARAAVVRQMRGNRHFAGATLTGVRIVRIWREDETWYALAVYRE